MRHSVYFVFNFNNEEIKQVWWMHPLYVCTLIDDDGVESFFSFETSVEWNKSGNMILLIFASCSTAVNTLRTGSFDSWLNPAHVADQPHYYFLFFLEQPARNEVFPNGRKKIIAFVLNTRFALANA